MLRFLANCSLGLFQQTTEDGYCIYIQALPQHMFAPSTQSFMRLDNAEKKKSKRRRCSRQPDTHRPVAECGLCVALSLSQLPAKEPLFWPQDHNSLSFLFLLSLLLFSLHKHFHRRDRAVPQQTPQNDRCAAPHETAKYKAPRNRKETEA